MKFYLMILFLICGCSSYQQEESRAEKFEYGKVSSEKTAIKVFYTGVLNNERPGFYLYMELKDKNGRLIDSKHSKFLMKNNMGEAIPFTLHRSARGKYYISPGIVSSGELVVSIKEAIFKVRLNPFKAQGDDLTSKLILRKSMPYKAIFRLITPVPLPSMPEIITEGGNGVIEGIGKINGTTWEFSLIYPEQDQLIYISARSQGVLLSDRYRFQHVELK